MDAIDYLSRVLRRTSKAKGLVYHPGKWTGIVGVSSSAGQLSSGFKPDVSQFLHKTSFCGAFLRVLVFQRRMELIFPHDGIPPRWSPATIGVATTNTTKHRNQITRFISPGGIVQHLGGRQLYALGSTSYETYNLEYVV